MPLNISHDIPMKSRSITDVGPTFSHAGFDLGQREPKGDEKQPAGTTGTGTVLYDHITEGFSSGISRLNPLTTAN